MQPKEKMNYVLESLKPGRYKHNYMKKSILFPEGKRQESPLKSTPSVQECGEISKGATWSLDPTSQEDRRAKFIRKPSLEQQGRWFISLLSYIPQDFLRLDKIGFNLRPASSPWSRLKLWEFFPPSLSSSYFQVALKTGLDGIQTGKNISTRFSVWLYKP